VGSAAVAPGVAGSGSLTAAGASVAATAVASVGEAAGSGASVGGLIAAAAGSVAAIGGSIAAAAGSIGAAAGSGCSVVGDAEAGAGRVPDARAVRGWVAARGSGATGVDGTGAGSVSPFCTKTGGAEGTIDGPAKSASSSWRRRPPMPARSGSIAMRRRATAVRLAPRSEPPEVASLTSLDRTASTTWSSRARGSRPHRPSAGPRRSRRPPQRPPCRAGRGRRPR
jgi:hypothetical protein